MQDKAQTETLRVFVRVRPFLPRELKNGSSFPVIDVQETEKELHAYEFLCPELDSEAKVREMLLNPKHFQVHSHTYDFVFDDKAEQSKIYSKSTEQCLDYLLNGYNSTIIAYGQTGTGKTYTMEGNPTTPETKGLIPRVLEDLFVKMETGEDEEPFKVTASYVQIYNENLSDLLEPTNKGPLNIRQDKYRGMVVENISEKPLESCKEALEMLARGCKTRVSASTKMNDVSSRSHAIFIIRMERKIDKNHKVIYYKNLYTLNIF